VKRAAILAALAALPALAQPGQPAPPLASRSMKAALDPATLPDSLQGVGIEQKLDQQIPLNLEFRDEYGQKVTLAKYFEAKKPVLLAPVYFRCPMLCTQILSGLEGALRAVSFNPGKEFEIVAFSFDPKDTPESALSKKELYLRRYRRPDTKNGWHFLTGDETNIKALLDALGYRVKYDPKTDQYAHASGVMIATPEGRLSKYFYGVEFSPRDIRLGLVEASEDKIGNPVDAMLLFCFHYDPATGKYGAVAMNLVRFAGAGFVLFGGVFLLIMFRRDFRRDRNPLASRSEGANRSQWIR
jgi:protein SCO1/2